MKFDFWYGNTLKDVYKADCYFYPNAGHYAGNMWDKEGKMIGDYTATDSTKIEKVFPGIFN